jgi:tRNA-5-taurinomethyluridine 2-sulfurtransferase
VLLFNVDVLWSCVNSLISVLYSNSEYQVRHNPEFHHCTVTEEQTRENGDVLMVHLFEDDQGLAAGQFAAFYCENVCLGSGIIVDSWDEMSFPVCSRALEIARLEDKSSLGKPVRIMNLEHIAKSEQEATEVA